MTVCQVCNKELKIINNSHLKSHNLTPVEYDKIFPGQERYDIEARMNLGVNTSIKHDLFDELNKDNIWLLGLLTADGSFGGKSKPLVIQLYNTNKGLIIKFKELSNCSKEPYERVGLKGQLGRKVVYHLSISSLQIINRLKELNAFGNKDQRNPFNNIPEHLKWPFIRGLFDGDGNTYFDRRQKRFNFNIAGRRHLIQDVYEWICKDLEIRQNKLYKCSGTDKTVYFTISPRPIAKEIYKKMYQDHNGYMNEHKFNKFTRQIKEFPPVMEVVNS